jgi:hypothetical protein
MRLSLLASSLALASIATAQAPSSRLSDEQRAEIRALIRDEIRAALKEHAAQTTTTKGPSTMLVPTKTTIDEAKPHTFQWITSLQPESGTGTTKTKVYRMADGKLEEAKLEDITDTQGSFRVVHGDGAHTFKVVKTDGTKHDLVMVADPKVDVVVAKDAEKLVLTECCKALEAAKECCEAVEGAKKGEKAEGECECEEGEEAVIEVHAKPAKEKAKKNKKGAKKNKAPKVEKIDDATELKISEVPERTSR